MAVLLNARRVLVAVALVMGAGALLLPLRSPAHPGDDHVDRECLCCIGPAEAVRASQRAGGRVKAQSARLSRVGFCRLRGFNADVWGHEGFAYVGSAGSSSGAGVAIVDLSRPTKPRLVGRVAKIAGTTQEDVAVARLATPSFRGNLLVVGIQARTAAVAAPRGLDLWDVTDPRRPLHLAFLASGPGQSGVARGVHELHVFQRGARAFVAGMVPESEERDGTGDFRLIEVTDPRKPVQLADWGAFKDGGLPLDGSPFPWGHSVTVDGAGTTAILSLWDAGNVFLDISEPSRPVLARRIAQPAGPAGNVHSISLAHGGSVMLVSDENLSPLSGASPWGALRLWDIRDPARPLRLGQFATRNAAALPAKSRGLYSIHNTVVQGTVALTSWYSDGVRAVDITDPSAPREIAYYVPRNALVWGIHADRGLILASDIRQGLYVLRLQNWK